jgi:hypothetical protein
MKKTFEKTAYWAGVLVLGIIVGVTIKVVGAWVEPNQMPPGGNIAAPLNTGNIGQSKQGGLTLNIGGATYGLIVDKGLVGIGTTTPKTTLDVNGDISAHNLNLNNNLNVGGDATINGNLNVTGSINGTDNGNNYMLIVDEETDGTNVGSGSGWQTRNLTKIKENTTDTAVSLSNNRMKLKAGTYRCQIDAPVFSSQFSQAVLKNVTKDKTVLIGTEIFAHASYPVTANSIIVGRFTVGDGLDVAPNDELEVQQYTLQGHPYGFGYGLKDGVPEIFTIAQCWKEK